MRRAAALLSAPLRLAVQRRAFSFRHASTSAPRRFLPAATAAFAAAGAALYAYSSRVETAEAPVSDQSAIDVAAAARAGTVLPGLPDYSLEQVLPFY
jgi:hypothetical protein